ncbi:MAG: hypothetical protein HY741_04265 [Chloroflexi bacterium]|nr:hypothetical protein [Chloroflexota bacterium]
MKKLCVFVLTIGWMASVLPVSAQAQASIQIVKPGDRRNVALGELEVTVAITGANVGDGYSWQIFIDGVPQSIVHNTLTTRVRMDKPTGPRRLKAVLYDPQGSEIAANEILVLAAPVENHDPVFNRAWFTPFMAVFTVAILALILLGLRVRPRAAA